MSLKPLKELTILNTLRAHPMHGYALVEVLEGGLGWTVGLTRSTVYGTLRRFVERGWITGEVSRDQRYPEREVYSVTPEGELANHALLQSCIEQFTEGTHPVAALLAHLDEVPALERERALKVMLKERRARLQALELFPPHDGMAGTALELLLLQVRAEVEVLERALS